MFTSNSKESVSMVSSSLKSHSSMIAIKSPTHTILRTAAYFCASIYVSHWARAYDLIKIHSLSWCNHRSMCEPYNLLRSAQQPQRLKMRSRGRCNFAFASRIIIFNIILLYFVKRLPFKIANCIVLINVDFSERHAALLWFLVHYDFNSLGQINRFVSVIYGWEKKKKREKDRLITNR